MYREKEPFDVRVEVKIIEFLIYTGERLQLGDSSIGKDYVDFNSPIETALPRVRPLIVGELLNI